MKKTDVLSPITLAEGVASKIIKVCMGIAVLGLIASALLFTQSAKTFYFSYLVAFGFFLTITIGSLFFVLIHSITRAGWGVAIRRIPETFAQNVGLMAILFIPILFGLSTIYEWVHPEHVSVLLAWKQPYLNVPFFLVRAAVFFGVWILLARRFYNASVAQDSKKDNEKTLMMQKSATWGILLFALTVSFASIDWFMSVTPEWFSTIFGVYFFATSAVTALAVISLTIMFLRRLTGLKSVVTVEHFHDLGKLIYGFNIFWAYISFSQFFLIWYASIPEEVVWYYPRVTTNWIMVGRAILIGHFAIPFVTFMSKHARRNLTFQALIAILLVAMNFVEYYWIVMPNISPKGVQFSILQLAPFVALFGVYFAVFFKRLKTASLVPVNDPRIQESLHLESR